MSFYELLPDQVAPVGFITTRPNVALLAEQGTGKTVMTVVAIRRLSLESVLLVVPLTNIETTWLTSVQRQLPEWTVCRTLEEFRACKGKRVLLMHYEAVPAIISKLRRVKWSLVVYDEAQRLKERSSLASRTAYKLRNAERRWALTGTPMDDDPSDLWAIMRFVDDKCLGSRWQDFDLEYMQQPTIDLKKYRPGSVMFQRMQMARRIQKRKLGFRFEKLEQFHRAIEHVALRLEKSTAELPACRVHHVPVTLFGAQARVYRDLERHMVARVAGVRVMTPLRITQIAKLQQIAGGFLIDEDGDTHDVGRAKERKLRSLLQRHPRRPVVVFCKFRRELETCERVLRETCRRVAVLYGKVKDKKRSKDRTNMIRDFQSGKLDALVCQVKTGGVGVDLFRSSLAFVYSAPYSWIDFDQMLARLHRHGQENDVDIFCLWAEGTVDEDIKTALDEKCDVTKVTLNRLKGDTQEKKMSKDKAKKADAPVEKKKSNLPERPQYKYNVGNLAEALGIEPASVRIALRKNKVAKAEGGVYGWNTKADFDEVVKSLKPAKSEKPAKTEAPAKTEKKAKKAA